MGKWGYHYIASLNQHSVASLGSEWESGVGSLFVCYFFFSFRQAGYQPLLP